MIMVLIYLTKYTKCEQFLIYIYYKDMDIHVLLKNTIPSATDVVPDKRQNNIVCEIFVILR